MSKLDLTKPLQTESGIKVTILSTSARGRWPVVGYLGNSDVLYRWDIDGKMAGGIAGAGLVPVPPPKQYGYINVYPVDDRLPGTIHLNLQSADYWATAGRIGCIKVELVEGQWDE